MGGTVLIVEDQLTLAKNIARFFSARGFISESAATASEAARRLREIPIDLVLLDVNLPDCNGFEFLRAVRPFYPRLRTVAMSGHATKEDERLARELGVKKILIKPFPLYELEELIRRQRPPAEPCSCADSTHV